MSARFAVMALRAGHDFVHHELRVPLVPGASSDAQGEHRDGGEPSAKLERAQWVDGIFETPKYASARLEAPLAVYDPNHRIQWRVHELLHRRVGFFWRPDLTPFEAYLGARASELLPVVHWYGFDEAFRPRCAEHRGQRLFREHCEACEREARPFWEQPTSETHAQAERFFEEAFAHLGGELDAMAREREQGRRWSTPHGPLDASSDAAAYAKAHWERMTAWSFGAWVELFCIEGVDYAASCAAMHARVEGLAREAVCGELPLPLEGELEEVGAARARQELRDLGQRCLVWIEARDDDALEAELWPVLEQMAGACRQRRETAVYDEAREALLTRLEALASATAEGAIRVACTGAMWRDWSQSPQVRAQIDEGLRSASSARLEALGPDELREFLAHESFAGPGELRRRLANWVESGGLPDSARAELWSLELCLRARPHVDLEAEHFACMPDEEAADWPPGQLRAHASLRRGRWSAAAVTRLLGWDTGEASTLELACVYVDNEARVIEADAEIAAALDALEAGERPPLDELARSLLRAGLWVWLPTPR